MKLLVARGVHVPHPDRRELDRLLAPGAWYYVFGMPAVGGAARDHATASAVSVVVRSIALAPLIATVLALTTPAVVQELSSVESARRLTLFGMIGQFDGLDSASGVVPVVVILVVALVLQLTGAIALLTNRDPGSTGAISWLPLAVTVTGLVVVVASLLVVPVLTSADDVRNPEPAVATPYNLTAAGWAHLVLAGVVAIAAGSLSRAAREWLE